MDTLSNLIGQTLRWRRLNRTEVYSGVSQHLVTLADAARRRIVHKLTLADVDDALDATLARASYCEPGFIVLSLRT